MAKRINEDIRLYTATDPYYYEVDNLPLQDLAENDKRLQTQIDELNSNDRIKIDRSGFNDLAPYIDPANPGRVYVRAGNFIGRAQRSSTNEISTGDTVRSNNGILEQNTDPAELFSSEQYNVTNPGANQAEVAKWVGRTALYQFLGGSVSIDSFDRNEFQTNDRGGAVVSTPPRGRIDLIGITTLEGAFDDSTYLPNNYSDPDIDISSGQPRLGVVKGAGMIYGNANTNFREIVVGEKYFTIGTPQEMLNDYGRKFTDGTEEADPSFGTVPSPDDLVNLCLHRADVQTSLLEFATANRNASFFLPIAYVFVPDTYDSGEAISTENLKDIRPFFRTAELTLSERQAIAGSLKPSVTNVFITSSHLDTEFTQEVNRDPQKAAMQQQINALTARVDSLAAKSDVVQFFRFTSVAPVVRTESETAATSLTPSKYLVMANYHLRNDEDNNADIIFRLKDGLGRVYGEGTAAGLRFNTTKETDGFGTYIFEADISGATANVDCFIEMEVVGFNNQQNWRIAVLDSFAIRVI